ncbi:hypothetical protein Spith_0203 [Spirochaeta thermophila DSM 6578]|uniref:Uncharacterized protein n=1 Tax=Winmispira thermophila (strain ATCC 700085 / DSM 6578 / Z-1203) TaxID=869211 RepID=G0GCS1_WINT7|nr:hypothetical protein [Spirochaeta thermophila]AEJ60490.1 hypothetical protein Spith_0203 [Spirochaeta thermophila DSM 6578]
MRAPSPLTFLIGLLLLGYAVYHFVVGLTLWAVVKLLIGGGLIAVSFTSARWALVLLGHLIMTCGALLVAAGVYYAPIVQRTVEETGRLSLLQILAQPLFWGIFAILGGVCATMHGFCRCVRREWRLPG